jgi:hypothetical protein
VQGMTLPQVIAANKLVREFKPQKK